MLVDVGKTAFSALSLARERQDAALRLSEIGRATQVTQAVAHVEGLPELRSQELVIFPQGLIGVAFGLGLRSAGIVLLGEASTLQAGDAVRRTGRVVDIAVGEALQGRILDGLGRPIDDAGPLRATVRREIERDAPEILDRAPVERPLETGLKVVDALIPIGRGQRQLIMGDRQTGKTAVAVDTILNQRGKDVLAIYCAIGQRASAVAKVADELSRAGVADSTILVVAKGDDPPGLQFIAPYAAATIGEYFMERGRDVLVVYDDLTQHAHAYRQLSLLLRRPPGREAYPGDIFYIHARLLERATHLTAERGGGSLTALPVVVTQAQNLAAFIPTNLISITDGQIYLSPDLFQKGLLPAVDVGRSVSRVGGRAQYPSYRAVAGALRLSYAQFEELESFARFGTHLDAETRSRLERGRRVREVLKQRQAAPLPTWRQIAVMVAVTEGLFDPLPLDRIAEAERRVAEAVFKDLPDLCRAIEGGGPLTQGARDALVSTARIALSAIS